MSDLTRARAATGGCASRCFVGPRLGGLAAAGGLALLLLAGSAPFTDASAFLFDFFGSNASPKSNQNSVAPHVRKPRHKRINRIDPAEKNEPAIAPGTLQIVISINDQRLTLYSNGIAVAHSPISTGVPGHPTPTGIFSVIQKERFHRSNLYSDAPMPFMQRITWSGVALHEGVVPGRPASHGCIRMPGAFARQMWATTKLGARVIIARTAVVPVEITHPRLFEPRQAPQERPPEVPVADQPARRAATGGGVKTAEATDPHVATDAVQLRGRVQDGARTTLIEIVSTATAAIAGKLADGISAAGAMVGAKLADVTAVANTIAVARKAADHVKTVDAMRRAGPISVFISRAERKIFVRHKFRPLFEAPVTIRDASLPLGTHLYTAFDLADGGTAMRWMAVSMPTETDAQLDIMVEPKKRTGRKVRSEREQQPAGPAPLPHAAMAALDRIEIGKETLDRIAELLTSGASLIISDQSLGRETGRGTDFIVVMR